MVEARDAQFRPLRNLREELLDHDGKWKGIERMVALEYPREESVRIYQIHKPHMMRLIGALCPRLFVILEKEYEELLRQSMLEHGVPDEYVIVQFGKLELLSSS